MHDEDNQREREERTWEYLENFFGTGTADPSSEPVMRAHTTLTGRNQPEFHADAPWRLEPGLDAIPLLFIIRDANLQPPAVGPWLMEELRIDHELSDGRWHTIRRYPVADLPGIAPSGTIETDFWVFRAKLPLRHLLDVDLERRGEEARLRIVFEGRFHANAGVDAYTVHRYLETHLARDPLPLRRTASGSEPRHWFYGDTHYHSAFTNDIWEFGNPVGDARRAGIAIGLDWLVITDHSCDLDERDNGVDSPTRWERLKQELSRWAVSNHQFRCILGEEITVRRERMGYLHVLAIGGLRHLIEGGFWSDEDQLVKRVAKVLMRIVSHLGGYPEDAVERLFDKVHTLEVALAQLPSRTLVFAAHPQTAAQPPFVNGTWDEAQLTHPRLTGYEFWNGRTRRKTRLLGAPTDDPFQEPEWNDPAALTEADDTRIKQLRQWAEEKWDPVLQQGVDEWLSPDESPGRSPVFIAGSDAHGDFNYSVGVGWDYQHHGLISDNALGRVRTVVHLPDYQSSRVPPMRQILAALRKGACVVTDGPVIELHLRQGSRLAHMGEVLTIEGNDPTEMAITIHTTPEFGTAEQVEVVTYVTGDGSDKRTTTTVSVGTSTPVELEGVRGYCRAMVQTTGQDGERFCCFTNPVWVWNPDDQPLRLRVLVRLGPS